MEQGDPLALGGVQADRPLLLRGWEGSLKPNSEGAEKLSLFLCSFTPLGSRMFIDKKQEAGGVLHRRLRSRLVG
jgi:hypothetical protein